MIYAGWLSPRQVQGQKVWQHRRALCQEDMEHFKEHISTSGIPYFPGFPPNPKRKYLKKVRRIISKSPSELMEIIHRRFSKKTSERKIYDGVKD